METKAVLRHARISPSKARLVANQVRGMHVDKAIEVLKYSNKKAGEIIKKILDSAIANAENNDDADVDELYVSTIFVDEGPVLKRIQPRARGRADRIIKRTSHITVKVSANGGN